MKKLVAFILVLASVSAFAINYQMWFQGPWESTVQYSVKPIYGSSSKTAPVVISESNTYIANGASTPIKGSKPASNPVAWTKIS